MSELSLPQSIRKFIRREKDRIRRQAFDDPQKQEAMIANLYRQFLPGGQKENSTGKEKQEPAQKPAKNENKLKK